jgi:hypothetical protein
MIPYAITLYCRVRLKQRIRFPLFERLFRRISVLPGASRQGGGGGYYTLAERYGKRICYFTLNTLTLYCKLRQGILNEGENLELLTSSLR